MLAGKLLWSKNSQDDPLCFPNLSSAPALSVAALSWEAPIVADGYRPKLAIATTRVNDG